MSAATRRADWDALKSAISGEVVLPESPRYEAARKPAIARFHDARPQAIVLCETAEDVSRAILFARRSGLETTPRSGGHCFAGRSSKGEVVLDVSPMRSVSVSGGVATVGAGARLGGVYDALDGHGLTNPAGGGLRRHAVEGDVHEPVAWRFVDEGFARVLDVGCGERELARYLPDGAWVGLDNSQTMLDRAPVGGVLGEATALPFPNGSFDGVAILYVLYHLPDPRPALGEAHRVMRQGGLIAVAAPSRHDSPELAHALPKRLLTFDAELAPGLLRGLFEEPEVKRWDAPLVQLPTVRAVRDYLLGKQGASGRAQAVAAATKLPLSVTKRGALLFARKPSSTIGRPRANRRADDECEASEERS